MYPAECSPTAYRCSTLFGDIWPMVLVDQTSEENLNACIEIFPEVLMHSRSMAITRVSRRSFAELLVNGGAALALPKFVHPESTERDRTICVSAIEI